MRSAFVATDRPPLLPISFPAVHRLISSSSPFSRISNPKASLGLEATDRKTDPYLRRIWSHWISASRLHGRRQPVGRPDDQRRRRSVHRFVMCQVVVWVFRGLQCCNCIADYTLSITRRDTESGLWIYWLDNTDIKQLRIMHHCSSLMLENLNIFIFMYADAYAERIQNSSALVVEISLFITQPTW